MVTENERVGVKEKAKVGAGRKEEYRQEGGTGRRRILQKESEVVGDRKEQGWRWKLKEWDRRVGVSVNTHWG